MNQVGFGDPKADMVYLSSLFLCRINAFQISLFRGLFYWVTGTRQVASQEIGLIAVSELATCLKVINTAGPETRGIIKGIKKLFLCQYQGTHLRAQDVEFSDRKIKTRSRAVVNSL